MLIGSSGVLGLLWWLARWAWLHTHARIDESHRVSARVHEDIYRQIRDHETEDRKRHEEVIRSTTRLSTQMERFVSDMASEKRTRAEVNKELFAELKLIRDRLPERRDHG